METEKYMLGKFGPLMSIDQLSEVLHRPRDGLRVSLLRATPWAKKINSCRLKIGRRLYFRTSDVARLLEGGQDEHRGN